MDLHYSQTGSPKANFQYYVLLPYGFTLFSNYLTRLNDRYRVLLPYGFTLFSNRFSNNERAFWFYYLMDLHYSQTAEQPFVAGCWFYYLMDLHYSQTLNRMNAVAGAVLLPYGFTLFSNSCPPAPLPPCVLLPYGFTLFSNNFLFIIGRRSVLLPYGFTLFSNLK